MLYREEPADFKPEFHTVSCYLLCGEQFLLLHRLPHKSQGSKWGLPAGKKDQKESLRQAVAREVREETSYTREPNDFELFKRLYVRYPDVDFLYTTFALRLRKKPDIRINPGEHQAFRWVSKTEALDLPLVDDLDECIKLFFLS